MSGLLFGKPRPHLLDKRDAARDLDAEDRRQRAICRKRSGGVCEVFWRWQGASGSWIPCHRRATENHHLKGGIGRRNRGDSILAAHRLEVCGSCHEEITGHVLVPIGENKEYAESVVYERRR
jgi:hypothetical protein